MDTLERLYTTHFKTLDRCGTEAAQASEAACDLVGAVTPGGGECVWDTRRANSGTGSISGPGASTMCVAEPVDVLIGRNGFGASADAQTALVGIANCVRAVDPGSFGGTGFTMGQSVCSHDDSCGADTVGAFTLDLDADLRRAANHCPTVRPDVSTGRWRGYPAQCHNASSCLITVRTSSLCPADISLTCSFVVRAAVAVRRRPLDPCRRHGRRRLRRMFGCMRVGGAALGRGLHSIAGVRGRGPLGQRLQWI